MAQQAGLLVLLAEDQACLAITRPEEQEDGLPTTRLAGIGRRAGKASSDSHLEHSAPPRRLFQESSLERTGTQCCLVTATHRLLRGFLATLSFPLSTPPHQADQGWRNIWRNLVL